jgi:hypothetical protein
MAYEVSSTLDRATRAESEAFRRLVETPDLDAWHEAFGAWLRAVRKLQRERALRPVAADL